MLSPVSAAMARVVAPASYICRARSALSGMSVMSMNSRCDAKEMNIVMPALVAGIHDLGADRKTWMAGT